METKCCESPANAPLVPGLGGGAGIYIDWCIMTNDFRSHNVITFVYDRKNKNHWPLLVTYYSDYKHSLSGFGCLYSE